MLDQIKPGHVLRFTNDIMSILSPSHAGHQPQTSHLWPAHLSSLGRVDLISHPSGALGDLIAKVAVSERGGINPVSLIGRKISYSDWGQQRRTDNNTRNVNLGNIGQVDFVGYTDTFTNYVQSANTVFSKDFSGCVMVAYTRNGQRYVAHAAANATPDNDCKQAFLTEIQNQGATLIGWFKPFVNAVDGAAKFKAYMRYKDLIANPTDHTTIGAISAGNHAYSITVFKPTGINTGHNDYVITDVKRQRLSQSWTV